MKLSSGLRFLIWILVIWGIFALLATFTPFPELNWFAILILASSIYILRERPLIKAGFPASFETGVGLLALLGFTIYLVWVLILPKIEAEDLAAQACSPKSLEMQCYTFSQDNCSAVWARYEQDCREEVKRTIISKRSTALTGPIVRKCIFKRLDQAFHSNRRTPLNPECQQHFNSLDAPSL